MSVCRRGGSLREGPHQRERQEQVAYVTASRRCGQEKIEGVETRPGADLWVPGFGAATQHDHCYESDDGEQDRQANGATFGPCECRELDPHSKLACCAPGGHRLC